MIESPPQKYIPKEFEEKIQKFPDRAEAERRYFYPYVTIEEIMTAVILW